MWDWNGSVLNARNFFSSTVPFNNFNDWTANVGGPIRKNKLFYFANYEGLRSPGPDRPERQRAARKLALRRKDF